MNIHNDRDLDDLLTAADPLTPGVFDDLDREFCALFSAITVDRPAIPLRRRRSIRLAIGAGASAAVLTVGGVAAASWQSAHTGSYATGGEADGGEFLRFSGDDFATVARQIAQGIPFPPGDSADAYIPRVFAARGLMTTEGVRSTLELDAQCAWQGYWLQAADSGDVTAQQSATEVLRQVPGWQAISRQTDPGFRESQTQLATAAVTGDSAAIQQSWTANCTELPRQWQSK